MSVNTAHANNGVLLHAGEYILLHCDSVNMEFLNQDDNIFKGAKHGRIYLTSHRMIFNNQKTTDAVQSFSAPFVWLSDVKVEQPVFGANYISGKVQAEPNGNFVDEMKFKLYFKAGGAIEYGQALLKAASTAQSNFRHGYHDDPPPYAPTNNWHEVPPPVYQPPPGYYGWIPMHEAFSSAPPANGVFMTDLPPPYPGIGGPPSYTPQNMAAQQPPQQQQQQNDEVSWMGFSAPPPPQQQQQQPGAYQQQPHHPGAYQQQPHHPGAYQQQPQHPGAYQQPQNAGGYQPPPYGAYAGYIPQQPIGYMMEPGGQPMPSQPGYPGYPGGAPMGYMPPGSTHGPGY